MISIITPTYNRGYIINNLYESLKQQTCQDFEWIVIDDGSKDDTSKLFDKWAKEKNQFAIEYEYTENGGKHRAINYAVKKVHTDFCFIVDSDDYLTNDAVESIHEWIDTIKNDNNFAGVAGLRQYPSGNIIGRYPKSRKYEIYVDADNLERRKKHLTGDKAEVYRTDILKKYPFPEFEGENFLTEDVIWNRIAIDGYRIRWFNHVIYICEYLEDGLTKGKDRSINNFKGFTEATKMRIKYWEFPYNYLSLSIFYNIAIQLGVHDAEIAELLDVSKKEIAFAKIISIIKRMIKKVCFNKY
ncbi:glycosyltransferase family 2 protein [Eubacterium limosum]|uniref:Glycosyltransferase family 2 protein n=1 Tax=Eubacterium limosum TaxID=1736 RepID=A0ABT5UJJ3_EUBLI|nr:glycosyltransferase family 2 protein [Eubacterium limosum]MCB6569764.1 glycosyltransferase family 2 protein [Eubacterium limosum]MDE1469064.1 glycosyltransferase family 2 protein [Eubacterium limosum]